MILWPRSSSSCYITSKANGSTTTIILGQDSQRLVHLTHAVRPSINQSLPRLLNVTGSRRGDAGYFAKSFCAFTNAHQLEEVRLGDWSVDLDSIAGNGGSLGNGMKVDVGAEVDETRGGKGADEAVLANAAEGVDGDGVGGAVVEDEGGAAGGWFRVFWGAADAGGEVGGVEGGVGADFDDGAGGLLEFAVAGGGFGEVAGVAGGGGGEDELELGRGFGHGGGG